MNAAGLRAAGAAMRDAHGPDHERHDMWSEMAHLMDLAADAFMLRPDEPPRNPRDRRLVYAAIRVADLYQKPAALCEEHYWPDGVKPYSPAGGQWLTCTKHVGHEGDHGQPVREGEAATL